MALKSYPKTTFTACLGLLSGALLLSQPATASSVNLKLTTEYSIPEMVGDETGLRTRRSVSQVESEPGGTFCIQLEAKKNIACQPDNIPHEGLVMTATVEALPEVIFLSLSIYHDGEIVSSPRLTMSPDSPAKVMIDDVAGGRFSFTAEPQSS